MTSSLAFRLKYKEDITKYIRPEQKQEVRAEQLQPERFANYDERICQSIFNIIRQHDINNKIKSDAICKELKIEGTTLRLYVHYLRCYGYNEQRRICSDTEGYFLAVNKTEIEHTIKQLRSRAMKILEAVKGIESSFDVNVQIGMF